MTYYIAVCDRCQTEAEYCEYTAFGDAGEAVERAEGECDWFERTVVDTVYPPSEEHPRGLRSYKTIELLCRNCQKCDVCGGDPAYEVDDHLVCEKHENHEFDTTEGEPSGNNEQLRLLGS